MTEAEAQILRMDNRRLDDEVKILKKRLDQLFSDVQGYFDVTDPPVTEEEQEVITAIQLDTDTLEFQKKTRTVIGKFINDESGWTTWVEGTTCGGTTLVGIQATADESTQTMALMRLTGAI